MISIVLPVFNEEEYISGCLESLKQQDYVGEYEVIVVDNGSTDRSAQVARELGARVVCCPGRGTFRARQAGADAACGEIVVQADADSVYPKDWLSRIAKHFLTHPEAVAVGGPYFYYDPPYWARLEYFIRHSLNKLGLILVKRPVMVSGANFAFRREAFVGIGGYRVDSLSPDQYDISRRLGWLGRVIWDTTLSVLTSARRVKRKSIVAVAKDMCANITTIFSYFARSYTNALGMFLGRKPAFRTALTVLPPVLIAGFLLYGYAVPSSQVFGKVYYQGHQSTTIVDGRSEKLVALTFDDGPNDKYTPQVLDILDNYDVKATFFVVGKNVEKNPDIAKRILAEGNVLGNHSYSHDANHALTDEGCKDLCEAQEAIYQTVGVKPHLYRPPHGKLSPWEIQYAKQTGLIEVTWSVSSNDLHVKSPEVFARNIVREVKPGKIVLLHDGCGTAEDTLPPLQSRALTVKALPLIIESLRQQGYEFVTVPELLNVPAYDN